MHKKRPGAILPAFTLLSHLLYWGMYQWLPISGQFSRIKAMHRKRLASPSPKLSVVLPQLSQAASMEGMAFPCSFSSEMNPTSQ